MDKGQSRVRHTERGVTLVLVALSMVMVLGMAGLAIDLVSLYVGRGEAQRAADAAALAGALEFVSSGCTSDSAGCVAGGPQETLARQRALDLAQQNNVSGVAPVINPADINFAYPAPRNPTITVTVARDTAHGNPMPTFFMKIFGLASANISASATAEAFNPSGSDVPVGAKCLKPWMLPNCDWEHKVAASNPSHNPSCPDGSGLYASYYVQNNDIVNPVAAPAGVTGQLTTIKPGQPNEAPAPSKFYPIFFAQGPAGMSCPACGSSGGGQGAPSASNYQSNIECCNQNTLVCGRNTVQPITGNKVGPTRQGVECLIHQGGGGSGQDTLDPGGPPWRMRAGANNPYFPVGSMISTSDSTVTLPIYNGGALCPGMGGCGSVDVDVIGFMQVFIQETDPNDQGAVRAYIMNVSACGGSNSPEPNPVPVTTGSGSPIPIRLIQRPQ